MTIPEQIAIMKHAADGESIQRRFKSGPLTEKEWKGVDVEEDFNFVDYDYRIKPPKKPKNWLHLDPESDEWQHLAGEVAMAHVGDMYPCKTCGYPVIDGYCCQGCGEQSPQD